jgi:hypothetical protein
MGHVRWMGPSVINRVRASVDRSLLEIAKVIESEAARMVSTPQEPAPHTTAPEGHPPKMREGDLHRGYWSGTVSTNVARVGNSEKHALFTELGTASYHTQPSDDMSGGLDHVGGSPWIESKGNYPMRWIWWGTDFEIEKNRVKGQLPRPVLVPAAKASREEAIAILKKNSIA